jgi:hypothetical protein
MDDENRTYRGYEKFDSGIRIVAVHKGLSRRTTRSISRL